MALTATKKTIKKTPSKPRKTKAEMRVLIAKDVLKLLSLKRIIPEGGCYVSLNPKDYEKASQPDKRQELERRMFHSKILKPCCVCALGSMFLVEVDRNNKLSVGEVEGAGRYQVDKRLNKYFSTLQLDLIESFFEGCNMGSADHVMPHEVETHVIRYERESLRKAKVRSSSYPATTAYRVVLTRIMKNIVKNNGTFKPSQD